ncbi:MAG: NUDIX hydrolase [Candidatus Levyibacteriota bacterium]
MSKVRVLPGPLMKLPPKAKKVFQGKIFSVFQWEQQLYDGSTATFEMLKRPGTIQIIPTSGDEIYLSYEEQPTKPRSYTLLGGRQEPDEEPLVTAKRELREESGLESDDWELYKTYKSEGKIAWPLYLYIARNCRKVAKPKLDPGEKIEVKQVSFEAFLSIVSDEDFWGAIIANDILRMRLDPTKLEKFRHTLFTSAK